MEVPSVSSRDKVKKGKTLLIAKDVSFGSPSKKLFDNLNLTVNKGELVVVTGQSGLGKSALLRLLAGHDQPAAGKIERPGEARISYVPQFLDQVDTSNQLTVREIFYNSRGLLEAERREATAADKLKLSTSQELIEAYTDALEVFGKLGGYTAEADIEEIILGLKVGRRIELGTYLTELSSGQRTKLLIGQALFANPDLLLMDDPTSNLDVQSRNWLGDYIRKSNFGTVIATTDEEFMTRFATRIIEIGKNRRIIAFDGNYKEFMEKKARVLEAEAKEAKNSARRIDSLQETVDKFKNNPKVSSSKDMARVRTVLMRRVERMEDEHSALPGAQVVKEKKVKPQKFEANKLGGEFVLRIQGISRLYDDVVALDQPDLDVTLKRGDRFGIVGRNGSGKSTLLKTVYEFWSGNKDIAGFIGDIEWGQSLEIGYYTPGESSFDMNRTIMEEAATAFKGSEVVNYGRLRTLLQFFNFDSRDLDSVKAAYLSKGERVQLALAKIMLQKPNVLILDEPTDGLPDVVKDRFLIAVKDFRGTLIVVSHDSKFYDQLQISRELQLPSGEVIHK